MFSVIFEVQPKSDQWETYLGLARMLRPDLEQIDGFLDSVRYKSLTREGWVLSLSNWRDEKSLVRWRTHARHHDAQEKGRGAVLLDYHLRVGQVTRDTRLPEGSVLDEQRLDETETGHGTTATLIDAAISEDWPKGASPDAIAHRLGLVSDAAGLVAWDVFEAILTPGDVILLLSWRDQVAAASFEGTAAVPGDVRLRRVRVVRDYSMFDRREAPQYYPDVKRTV
jgi:heme-degrading monooxygenase HmoA